MCAPCLKMTTTGEAIEPIIISSDEDEEDTKPSKARLPYKSDVHKAEAYIVSSDEEDHEKPPQKMTCASVVNKEPDCQVSSSTESTTSPWKNLKFSEKNIKILQAKVKLHKLTFEDRGKASTSIIQTENHDIKSEPSTSSSTPQDEMAKEDSKANTKQVPRMEMFESMERTFFSSRLKRSKSPPSPSLKQSVITQESFSPSKKPTVYRCQRQEQPLHYNIPLWCSVQMRQSLPSTGQGNKDFSEQQMNSLQALKEESFHQSYLNTVTSFTSQCRRPPVAVLFHILANILLSEQSNCGRECYRILRQIQVLHPVTATKMVNMKITWEYISMIVKASQWTNSKSQKSGFPVNASMALSFIISVMEEEASLKRFSLVKTSGYRLLSVKHFNSNICDVVQWIGDAIKQHPGESSHGCGQNVCPVYLLQRMLMLSLSVNERPEEIAGRIADELFLVYNWQLQSTKEKILLLQSTQNHLLRMKLIELILSNCFPPQMEQDACIKEFSRAGLSHIIFVDFQRTFSQNMKNSGCSHYDLIDNCEVLIMLLAYLLQSFLFCRKKSLQKNSSDSLRIMSMDDTDVLLDIDSEVIRLRERLENFCSPSQLSSRSYQLLDLMSSLKSFALKLP